MISEVRCVNLLEKNLNASDIPQSNKMHFDFKVYVFGNKSIRYCDDLGLELRNVPMSNGLI